MEGKPTMSQSTANWRKMEEETCVYRCSKGLITSGEVTSCRLGQIRMLPLPETRGNVIPAISRRSEKKHQLHGGGGCWFKPTTPIKQQFSHNARPACTCCVQHWASCGGRCFDVGEVWIFDRLAMVWLWRLLWTVRFFGVCLSVCHPCSKSPLLDAKSALYSTSTFWTL